MSREPLASLGFCGKVPSKGDFIQSNFNADFIKNWNEWLQAVIAVSKEQLNDEWLSCYLTSPIWHFALSPGVCCDKGIHGTFIPSVDRVSRHYPFTMACENDSAPVMLFDNNQWCDEFETHILSVLDDDFDFSTWRNGLADLAPTEELASIFLSNQESLDNTKSSWVIQGERLANSLVLLHQQYTHSFGQYTIFWTLGSDLVSPCVVVCNGLPQVSQFVALLNGQWKKRQWNISDIGQ